MAVLTISPLYQLAPILHFLTCIGVSFYLFLWRLNDDRLHLLAGTLMIVSSLLLYGLTIVAPVSRVCTITYINNTTSIQSCTYKFDVNAYSLLAVVPVMLGIVHIAWWTFLKTRQTTEYIIEELI